MEVIAGRERVAYQSNEKRHYCIQRNESEKTVEGIVFRENLEICKRMKRGSIGNNSMYGVYTI